MEDNAKLIDSLLEKATDYSKTTLELLKLKAVDKTSDVVSTLVPHTVVFVIVASFLIFFNLGIAFWLGEILGKISLGFLIVAAFYGLIAIIVHFFMHKWLKKIVRDFIIKQALK
jgi:fatty acid desaturase